RGVLEGKKFVLASPTASGKTLIAEFCALKHVLEKRGKVLYLVPLRALASEKYENFLKYSKIRKPNGEKVKVAVSTGDYDSSDPYLEHYDIIITTNEKADSLLRHNARWLREVSLVVADEVHLLQDVDRGPTLEVALTRLRQLNPNIQILALSATIENVEEIAGWLDADYVAMDWRPVPLREGVLYSDEVIFRDGASRKISNIHSNPTISFVVETVKNGGQTLIFVEARRTAISLAQKIAPTIRKLLSKNEKRTLKNISEKILMTGERTSLSETLAKLVEDGVCAHHAGIHVAHRKIIEDSFRKGTIKVIVATPTLAAGVNLPARTVIINSHVRYEPGYGRMEIPILEYKQMAGRAGRPQYDEFGEAVLVASSPDEQEYLMEYYVCSKPEKIWSKLAVERTLRSHVLAAVASDFVKTEEGLLNFFQKTFYAYQYGEKIIKKPVYSVLKYLVENDMVKYDGFHLNATAFGKRVSELYIDPETAVLIRKGLSNKPKKLTEISFLHLVSHTPDLVPKLYPYKQEMGKLRLFMEEHEDEFMFPPPDPWEYYVDYEAFLGEIKCVKVLFHWIEEAKENEILEHFKVEPGDLYRLVEIAEWLLYATQELGELFGYKDLLPLIDELRNRVRYGVKPELLPLVSLEGVGRIRARALFNSGYRNIDTLKRTSLTELMTVPGIGQKLARKIKEEVGGKIRREELSGKHIEEVGVQESLESFSETGKDG
ncbi:extensin, partial [Candidatus Bathyarchaeota archaeon]